MQMPILKKVLIFFNIWANALNFIGKLSEAIKMYDHAI